jgi:hypothetical protein
MLIDRSDYLAARAFVPAVSSFFPPNPLNISKYLMNRNYENSTKHLYLAIDM